MIYSTAIGVLLDHAMELERDAPLIPSEEKDLLEGAEECRKAAEVLKGLQDQGEKSELDEYLKFKLSSGRELNAALIGMHIDDDEDVTALMIQNIDQDNAKYGNCLLIDKDGSTSYYEPEEGGEIETADLMECFACITDNVIEVSSYYLDSIVQIVSLFDESAAKQIKEQC